jgi:hypothetical protein
VGSFAIAPSAKANRRWFDHQGRKIRDRRFGSPCGNPRGYGIGYTIVTAAGDFGVGVHQDNAPLTATASPTRRLPAKGAPPRAWTSTTRAQLMFADPRARLRVQMLVKTLLNAAPITAAAVDGASVGAAVTKRF